MLFLCLFLFLLFVLWICITGLSVLRQHLPYILEIAQSFHHCLALMLFHLPGYDGVMIRGSLFFQYLLGTKQHCSLSCHSGLETCSFGLSSSFSWRLIILCTVATIFMPSTFAFLIHSLFSSMSLYHIIIIRFTFVILVWVFCLNLTLLALGNRIGNSDRIMRT